VEDYQAAQSASIFTPYKEILRQNAFHRLLVSLATFRRKIQFFRLAVNSAAQKQARRG
jgi:hypothetical protein